MSKLFDLHDNSKVLNALDSQTISTDTTTEGVIVDTAGFHGVEFILTSGTVTDGAYSVTVTAGDAADLSDGVTVDAADLLGSVAFTDADDNVAKSLGSLSKKRYVRFNVVSTGTTSGGVFGGVAVLYCPNHAPVVD